MGEKPKVLVVDDEDRIRRLIRMYLEREDFIIEEADNGADALTLALENDYDVILLDIMMPEMDGIEVCEAIRLEKTTPILMLTAKGEESNRVQGFESGDRKSTRLNSSHVAISYAVFCLKKKIKKNIESK